MKNYRLYLCFFGLLVLLGLSYAFQWTALFRILPWFFILLCPLMMIGMHGNHSGHSQREKKDKTADDDDSSSYHHA